jgi:hypothetical protein
MLSPAEKTPVGIAIAASFNPLKKKVDYFNQQSYLGGRRGALSRKGLR